MIRSQLNSYSGADPIWGFVALIAREEFTGEAAIGIDPRVRVFAVDGRVYFTEREGDAPIGTRLLESGAVTPGQLERGTVQIGDVASLARLFHREPSIDRDQVELTIELATESLLESIANKAVGMPEVFPLRHHLSGIHQWRRASTTTVPATIVQPSIAEAQTVEAEPVEVEAMAEVEVEAEPVEVEQAEAEPVEVEAMAVEVEVEQVEVEVEQVDVEVEVEAEAEPVEVEAVVEPVVVEPVEVEPVVEPAQAEDIFVHPSALPFVPIWRDDPLPMAVPAAPHDTIEETSPPVAAPLTFALPTLATLAPLPTLQAGPRPEPTTSTTSDPLSTHDLRPTPPVSPTLLAAPTPFGEPTYSLAAVDIWEMVDVLTDDAPRADQELVGSGGSDKRGRSWLRGRKS